MIREIEVYSIGHNQNLVRHDVIVGGKQLTVTHASNLPIEILRMRSVEAMVHKAHEIGKVWDDFGELDVSPLWGAKVRSFAYLSKNQQVS